MKSNISTKLFLLFGLAVSFAIGSCKKDDNTPDPVAQVPPMLAIELDHLAGASKFYLDSTYTTANGDQITASIFKYYISNVRLVRTDNVEVAIPNTYFLVNQEDETSMSLHMDSLPVGLYKSVKFIIGVDSARNVSGSQSGALDPTNAMFWSWNSGYIFLKIEGTSPSVPSASHDFTFHIGGFQGQTVNYKEVALSFNGDILNLSNNKHPELHLVVDVLEIFDSPTTIDLSTFPSSVTTPNASSVVIANNFADMIKYDHMHDE